MNERITLTVELSDEEHDARCLMRVPYDSLVEPGDWMETAIKDMRAECREKLKLKQKETYPK